MFDLMYVSCNTGYFVACFFSNYALLLRLRTLRGIHRSLSHPFLRANFEILDAAINGCCLRYFEEEKFQERMQREILHYSILESMLHLQDPEGGIWTSSLGFTAALTKYAHEELYPRRLLDVGCADGRFVLKFRQLGIESYGVDSDEEAITNAPPEVRSFLMKVNIDRESLPFHDNSFDTITLLGVLPYLRNHSHALKEIHRVLSPNGYLLVKTIYHTRDPRRPTARPKSFWILEMNRLGFKFVQDVDSLYPYALHEILAFEQGRKVKLARSLAAVPFGKKIILSYLKSQLGIFLFQGIKASQPSRTNEGRTNRPAGGTI